MSKMSIEDAKKEMEKFVKAKTTLRPAFVDVLLNMEPVKHGEWIELGDELYKCPFCGYEAQVNIIGWHCAKCGARLD